MPALHVLDIPAVDLAVWRAILDDGANGRARVLHHRCQAVRHLVCRIRSSPAPCVERVDGRQLRVEHRFELPDGFAPQFR